jgi:hypothetical protein
MHLTDEQKKQLEEGDRRPTRPRWTTRLIKLFRQMSHRGRTIDRRPRWSTRTRARRWAHSDIPEVILEQIENFDRSGSRVARSP